MSDEYRSTIQDAVAALNAGSVAVIRSMRKGMVNGMREFESKMLREQFTGRPGLKRVTGNAARSWHVKAAIETRDISVKLYTSTKYLRPFETGQPIKAPTGKALAIPLKPELRGVKPRTFSNLELIPRPGRPALLVIRRGKRIEPMYLLKTSVKRPRYLNIRKDFWSSGRKLLHINVLEQLQRDRQRGLWGKTGMP